MSLGEDLRLIKIYNPHNLTSDGMPFIWYRAREAQMLITPGWVLTVKGIPFKEAHWRDNGSLVFCLFTHEKKEALDLAIAKCKELSPDTEMVKGPWRGTWVTKKDLDAAKAKLKAFKKAEKATEGYVEAVQEMIKEKP